MTYQNTLIESEHELYSDNNYVAVASLGSFVPGYVLIVPKLASLNFAKLSKKDEAKPVEYFIKDIESILKKEFNNIVRFEHGPVAKSSSIGCSIDYAHLHIVPTDCPIKIIVEQKFPFIKWHQVPNDFFELDDKWSNCEYLYFYENGQGYISDISGENISSQFFRKLIANYEGKRRCYDWRKYSYTKNIEKTSELFEKK